MDYSRPDLADRLAADYELGLLRGRARDRFELLLPAHPALRAAAEAWRQRLAPLTGSVGLQAPPGRVWQRIETALFGDTAAAAAPVAGRWWQRPLVVWRGLSAAALAAAAFLGVQLAYPPARAPVVVVLSAAPDAAPAFVASFNADGRAVVTRPLQAVSMQPGRSLELWAVPARGAPLSLGLISAQGASVVQRGRVASDTAALAVTLEPAGGSPTGAPTGPIVYSGKLAL